MDKNIGNRDNGNLLQHREEFETVYGIISAHKKRAMNAMHNESLNMLWEVGAYVSDRLKKAAWGDGVVRMLADYIRTKSPKVCRTISLEQSPQNCHPKLVKLCHSK